MTPRRIVVWILACIASFLLSVIAWQQSSEWGAIGLVLVPLCLMALLLVVLLERR